MAFAALVAGNVTEVERVFESAVGLVAGGALPGVLIAEVDRVLEDSGRRLDGLAAERLIDRGVADRAFVADHFAVAADVLAVVTTETTLGVEVSDVIR